MLENPEYRIGIDVGGTFTDFVVANTINDKLLFYKEPSTPNDPSAAVQNGISALISSNSISSDNVKLIVHGTTIGLNSIIQRQGSKMALVVSQGTRDVFEIGRMRLPSSYDFTEPRETPLVPRNLVFEISARMDSFGNIIQPFDLQEIRELSSKLRQNQVESVAIMLLNSYRNPILELEVGKELRRELDGLLITESSVIWPEIREYERCLIAGLNSYIHPLMTAYFDQLQTRVNNLGINCPINITANNGGTVSIETARSRPIDTVLSGPASGVVASVNIGDQSNLQKLITFDMGGTSADISVCPEGKPEFTSSTFVGDFPLMMPVVNIAAIGAGGGSKLSVDEFGLLKVGPLSAGAVPGPVCYGRGGDVPTVTDCYLALGIIDEKNFLGGRMELDAKAAILALEQVAIKIGLEGPNRALETAEAAIRVATAKMATEINKLLAQEGVDPREFSLVAYGGAGATHANMLADEALLTSVLVPTAPGTFCALGAVLADVRRDFVANTRCVINDEARKNSKDWEILLVKLEEMENEAESWLELEGEMIQDHEFSISINLRYPNQADELEITIPTDRSEGLSPKIVSDLFHEAHMQLYGFNEPTSALQISTLRLGIIGRLKHVKLPKIEAVKQEVKRKRTVWHSGEYIDAKVYMRSELDAGTKISGPAIIEQPDTTIFILPKWHAKADQFGTLNITRE